MNLEINALLQYAVQMGLLPLEEYDYAANLLLDLLGEDSFAYEPVQPLPETADPILQTLLDIRREFCKKIPSLGKIYLIPGS